MKKSSFHSCNVLDLRGDAARLWHFGVSGNQLRLGAESTVASGALVPPKIAGRSLLTRRLNIAWLPPEQVFLRVVQLPVVELGELISMIEFQLEKLSPFPVAQIVWSIEILPDPRHGQQTVIVVIAAREAVEKHLGRLEEIKYLADHLEVPHLHQLLTVPPTEDGVWIFATPATDRTMTLVAWWAGGVLQQVQFNQLPADAPSASALVAQLNDTAWAGELEGWFKFPVRVHLVADPEVAARWESPLREWSGVDVAVTSPPPPQTLAELAASRAATGKSRANLLPVEFAGRYRQQFVDKLWMSGLGAVVAAYILGVIVYFAALYVLGWQKDKVLQQVRAISGSYTNTLRSKEKIEVLQTQLDLRFAALDALQTVSDQLPAGFVLTQFTFSRGKTLDITGTAPQGEEAALNAYASKLRGVEIEGRPVFSQVPTPVWSIRGTTITWNLRCELKLSES